jgi:alpha-ketoglutarate-dependent dioxygenase FTO
LIIVANEIEFEWIRQFYIQGAKHYRLHEWWHEPMQTLLQIMEEIEKKLVKVVLAFKEATGGTGL